MTTMFEHNLRAFLYIHLHPSPPRSARPTNLSTMQFLAHHTFRTGNHSDISRDRLFQLFIVYCYGFDFICLLSACFQLFMLQCLFQLFLVFICVLLCQLFSYKQINGSSMSHLLCYPLGYCSQSASLSSLQKISQNCGTHESTNHYQKHPKHIKSLSYKWSQIRRNNPRDLRH